MVQDTAGAGNHGGSLVFSTTSAGSAGVSQDWLTIASTGMATFSGELLCSLHTGDVQPLTFVLSCLLAFYLLLQDRLTLWPRHQLRVPAVLACTVSTGYGCFAAVPELSCIVS